MKSNRSLVGGIALAAAISTVPTFAGPSVGPIESTPEINNGDWCDFLKNAPGQLYKDKSNPIIQGVKLFGRAHYQAVYIDGDDAAGGDFSGTIQELRRLRGGGQIDFLNFFKLKAELNFADDDRRSGGDLGFGYESVQSAALTFDAGKAFDLGYFDSAKVAFGKQKLSFGGEQLLSSKKIKTIERSAIANYVRGGDGTGLKLSASKGAWSGSLGYFSNEETDELSYDFDTESGTYFWAQSSYEFTKDDVLTLDFLKVDNESEGGSGSTEVDIDYAVSAAYVMERGPYELLVNGIYGRNRGNGDRGGDFHALVVLPSYEVNDQLEVVFRYQYQAANADQGIRVNSRYTRSGDTTLNSNTGGRGDQHQSVYGGIVYKLCGHNAKFLFGVEYDNLKSNQGTSESVTYGGAFRMFF